MNFKNQLLKCILLFSTSFVFSSTNVDNGQNPILAIVLMVRDEGQVIVPTLKPYVEAGIEHILVYDTGSADNTMLAAEEYFKEKKLTHAYVIQEEHDRENFDFSIGRNRALELAEEKFPTATFYLMPDAEWYLHNVKELISFACSQKDNRFIPYYLLFIKDVCNSFYTPRLLRRISRVRFEGDIHEAPMVVSYAQVPESIYFELKPSAAGVAKSKKRWLRDEKKLLKRLAEDPYNPRTVFYLAQSYECLGELEKAQKYYKAHGNLEVWDQDKYLALLRCANVTEALESQTEKPTYTESIALYSKAYAMRPQRIEPLVRLGQIYWQLQNFTLCYLAAKEALKKPFPIGELLPINHLIYNYERYELMSKVAWHVKAYEMGEKASKKLLESYPDAHPQYAINLSLYRKELGLS